MNAIDQAFECLKAKRRCDDGSTMHMRNLYVAAIALAEAIDAEVTHRLLNEQRTEEPAVKRCSPAQKHDPFSFENVSKLLKP